ncbi:HdeA/HdeB family chaperone [uncultured Desulfovibrio sp.]|uniref:HdeA/HdeB family chaperone n=1 Tax=uncultured Desulfovibrio sp. TaxID=167968 RepID=UPI00260C37C3|nr:HdeA/HdeB family chaperone [uncultured Desulfovibrio sp.]
MKRRIAAVVLAILCAVPCLARAAEIDIARIRCKDILANEEQLPLILMWVDGYMSAATNNTVFSAEWMSRLAAHMDVYCATHPRKTVMEAMEAMPAEEE